MRALAAVPVGIVCVEGTVVVGDAPAGEQAAATSMRLARPANENSLVVGRICVS
jgi:hypothetical protein